MKSKLALLLIVAILTTMLAGCPYQEKNRFYEALNEYVKLAEETRSDLFNICINESSYMLAFNVEGEGHVDEITAYAENAAHGPSFYDLGVSMKQLDLLCTEIQDNKHGQVNYQDILDDALLLDGALINVAKCAVSPKGTAAEFKEEYGVYIELADIELEKIKEFLKK